MWKEGEDGRGRGVVSSSTLTLRPSRIKKGGEENVANWLGKLIFAKFRAIYVHQL